MSERAGHLQGDPTVDRLEKAMVRIASAVDRQRQLKAEDASAPVLDTALMAANIDALCVRIQGILEREEG